jgi:ketosteroid isomerase-like protein
LSERNVALAQNVYRAVNENDLATFLDLMHPDVELLTSGIYPDFRAAYRGRSGAADYWQAARGLWDNFEVEIQSCKAAGDRVLALLEQHVKGREGIEAHHKWGHLFEFADDRIRRVVAYDSWEAAEEAAASSTAEAAGPATTEAAGSSTAEAAGAETEVGH